MNKNFTDAFWMGLAESMALASTCRVNVGCVIVRRNELLGTGYVGSLHGEPHCSDVGCLFVETDRVGHEDAVAKRSCVRTIHAEMNAILRCRKHGSESDGWLTAYSTHQPCLSCLKTLLQIGTRRIVSKHAYRDEWRGVFLGDMAAFAENLEDDLHVWSFKQEGHGS